MEILRFALTAKARSVWILRQVDEGETHRDVGPAVCRIAAHCGCRQLAAVLLTVTVATIIFTSMPDVHIPHLDEDEPALAHAASASTVAPPSAPHRRHSVVKLLLEVALITTGVFLGLAGESWRESRHHHELAEQSLRRFRDEFKANRAEVLRVHQRHVDEEKGLLAYFKASGPALLAHMLDPSKPLPEAPDNVIDSAGFDYSAWDVALATESLAYIDPELVAKISAAYQMQRVIEKDHDMIAQVGYSFQNQVHWFRGVYGYFGDTVLHENLLLKRFDDLLPRLDKAIAGDE
jgi:hypothetical protein